MKKIIIIGAGPAGLTAAYELLDGGGDCAVTVFEESQAFGGISRTVRHNGNRMGHWRPPLLFQGRPRGGLVGKAHAPAGRARDGRPHPSAATCP